MFYRIFPDFCDLMLNYNQNTIKMKVIVNKWKKTGIFLKYPGFAYVASNKINEKAINA